MWGVQKEAYTHRYCIRPTVLYPFRVTQHNGLHCQYKTRYGRLFQYLVSTRREMVGQLQGDSDFLNRVAPACTVTTLQRQPQTCYYLILVSDVSRTHT